jgi:alkylation response protein AidB-like acyl-CoA dehydrogenase
MELEFSDEQLELRDAVRAVLERECPISLVRQVVEDAITAEELWTRMVELDWPSLGVSEADGGLGLGAVELTVVAEELGKVLAPAPFLATTAQFAPVLEEAGSADQRSRFLGGVASGTVVGTLAVAEESGAFGVAQPFDFATVARPDGGGFVLSGEKHFVFDGVRADEVVVAARLPGTAGDDGIGLFVLPGPASQGVSGSTSEGLSAKAMASIDGSRQYAVLTLNDVRIDADRVLGEPGSAAPALRRALELSTVSLTGELVGTCQAIFDIVHAYVSEREQFGVKIGSFQAIKHKLANMYVAIESARALTYFAAAAIAEDDDRRELAISMAKSSAGDCQKLVAQEGIQCLGGIGYTWEHDMHLYVKRAKASASMFGTGADHRVVVASLIGL